MDSWTAIVTDAWIMLPLGLILFIIVVWVSCDEATKGVDDDQDPPKE